MDHSANLHAETRPREFTARPTRTRARRTAFAWPTWLPRQFAGRLAMLAAAVAVPAMAAPGEWSPFADDAPAEITAMPFETAGDSFPGSAFYYLADEPYAPLPIEAQVHLDGEAGAAPLADADLGDAARPLVANGTSLDKGRALQCLTQAIYYEAASEPDAGQRAVAQVVLNRVAHPSYPSTVCGVVYQGSERRTGCQFTFTCDGSLARKPSRVFWDRAQRVAAAALAGAVYKPVGLATHYHTTQIHPYWADSLDKIGVIGAHVFYNFRGAAGRPTAFRFAHAGGEPAATPHPRAWAAADDGALDPVAVAKAYEAAHPVVPTANGLAPARAAAPAPNYSASIDARGGDALYSGERLPQPGDVRPEYAQSGQWIARP